jgi:protein phosphatase
VVAHAGLREEMHGRGPGGVREFCLYGETTGETDEYGLPVRANWAAEYRGKAMVVYGHTPIPEPEWLNNTVNIDTGAVFGGRLTALRYPEREFVSAPAAREYSVHARPLRKPEPEARSSQQEVDDVLDLEDVTGKRIVETRLQSKVTIREENFIAALEVMSRVAADPHWIVYLPPAMSPSETAALAEYLEYPAQAFEYFRRNGVATVVCEEKHMGSRAVVVVCRDAQSARERFGVTDGKAGVCYTRTGRPFFADPAEEAEFVARVRPALAKSGFWDEFVTNWFCLDCELMPWSAKACEQRQSLDDYRLAPFHLLASEGAVHADKTHRWHMEMLHRLAAADSGFLVATPYVEVELADEAAVERACRWWEQLTGAGGEGMVAKPLDFIARGPKGLVQPALKCRGQEYLRIVYGPEHTAADPLPRLRARGLSGKRSLAIREFALGLEALERFVRREPLRRVRECVIGVLAMESEPVDPPL